MLNKGLRVRCRAPWEKGCFIVLDNQVSRFSTLCVFFIHPPKARGRKHVISPSGAFDILPNRLVSSCFSPPPEVRSAPHEPGLFSTLPTAKSGYDYGDTQKYSWPSLQSGRCSRPRIPRNTMGYHPTPENSTQTSSTPLWPLSSLQPLL